MGESRLELVVAYLLVAGETGFTVAAPGHKRHGHPVVTFPVSYVFAYLDDRSGQLVPGHMGKPDVRVVSLPAMPVASADARGVHGQDDAVIGNFGIGDFRNGQRSTELGKHSGFHGISFLLGLPAFYES